MAKKKKDLDLASSSHLNQIQGSTNAIFNVIFVILALACIIPVVFIFMISISSEHSIKMNGYQFIPSAYSLDSYKFLLREGQKKRYHKLRRVFRYPVHRPEPLLF